MFLFTTFTLLLTLTRRALCTCYRIDGNISSSEDLPCSDTPSICCALGRFYPPGSDWVQTGNITRDECLPNGLCQNRYTLSGHMVVSYWRGDCTDKKWDKARCVNTCQNGPSGPNIYEPLTPCDGTSSSSYWCCGNNASCCGTGDQIHLNQIFGVTDTTTRPMSLPTGAATSQTVPSSTLVSAGGASNLQPGPTTCGNGSGNLSAGAKAGIGVGVTAGAAAIAGLLFFVYKALQWRRGHVTDVDEGPVLHEMKGDAAANTPRPQVHADVAELAAERPGGS